jgi:hypothetical protein
MPGMSAVRAGVMKRVKTVRSGKAAGDLRNNRKDRSIHGVAQGAPGAKMRCMSMHRWTVFAVNGMARKWLATNDVSLRGTR